MAKAAWAPGAKKRSSDRALIMVIIEKKKQYESGKDTYLSL